MIPDNAPFLSKVYFFISANNIFGDQMSRIKEFLIVFGVGAFLYGGIEVAFRGYTHWSMFLTGGILFYLLYLIFGYIGKGKILLKCIMGCAIITTGEFLVGCIVNLIFGMGVWDYSDQALNVFGQICLLFSLGWFFISIPASFIAGGIRRHLRYNGEIA